MKIFFHWYKNFFGQTSSLISKIKKYIKKRNQRCELYDVSIDFIFFFYSISQSQKKISTRKLVKLFIIHRKSLKHFQKLIGN